MAFCTIRTIVQLYEKADSGSCIVIRNYGKDLEKMLIDFVATHPLGRTYVDTYVRAGDAVVGSCASQHVVGCIYIGGDHRGNATSSSLLASPFNAEMRRCWSARISVGATARALIVLAALVPAISWFWADIIYSS